MEYPARAADRPLEEDVILAVVIIEVPGQGYCWKLRTADGETADESPIFCSLGQCLADARHSSALNPGTDPYLRRT